MAFITAKLKYTNLNFIHNKNTLIKIPTLQIGKSKNFLGFRELSSQHIEPSQPNVNARIYHSWSDFY